MTDLQISGRDAAQLALLLADCALDDQLFMRRDGDGALRIDLSVRVGDFGHVAGRYRIPRNGTLTVLDEDRGLIDGSRRNTAEVGHHRAAALAQLQDGAR